MGGYIFRAVSRYKQYRVTGLWPVFRSVAEAQDEPPGNLRRVEDAGHGK
jgi:hypothetical protein